MTNEEFIKKVNALSEDERGGVRAYLTATNLPAISDASHKWTLACLPCDTKSWEFTSDSFSMPGCVLKLMSELAESTNRERQGLYVILNGDPYHDDEGNKYFDCFLLWLCGPGFGRLETKNFISQKELANWTYTKPELDYFKKDKSWAMCEAIDALTVPLSEALKMGEDNDN